MLQGEQYFAAFCVCRKGKDKMRIILFYKLQPDGQVGCSYTPKRKSLEKHELEMVCKHEN